MLKKIVIFFLGCAAISACSKQSDDLAELNEGITPSAQTVQPAPAATTETVKMPDYEYPFVQERDPFSSLVGENAVYSDDKASLDQSLINLELRGIIKDKEGKIAMLVSANGESFTLRGGKVYDRRRHLVEGVSGVIKERSVVLTSKNKTVKELPLINPASDGH